jgi:hypothetical protein
MKTYIGTKIIRATPMTRAAYNQLRDWTLPENENGDDAGYLVEYTDGGKPNLLGYEGYVSWSPAEQFEKAYREVRVLTRPMVCAGNPVDASKTRCYPGATNCNGYCKNGKISAPMSYKLRLFDFGYAIQALKDGKRVAREGWNGKGMWLSMSGPIGGRKTHADHFWSKNNGDYAKKQPEGCATVLPCITMKTATGEILMGWLASQSDMLAEDWVVLA